MKKIIYLAAISLALISFTNSAIGQEKKKDKKNIKTMTCWASMDCENCQAKIEKNIAFEKGVKDLKVDLKSKLVTVQYRSDKTSEAKIEKAIKKLGFKTEIIKKKPVEEKKKKK
ncbi:MAG: heavy-metal-associated domain-containing protein [Bacteroidetes bacterium]|jgi:periplasmic mercuric ion binding protein|nr:heavy-metal-associated domain-containing protein [Bacteroidota bacterium]MBT4410974.1 heavy-metal-associated domain-containing protein [Bacteroidota bacterium]MBT6050370.1 heavy-metal-associated domain-containing protein [Candidatus Scalindua sp.]MBT7094670.1 heavy-metal-associated domain-containing protein [Bacteroidota bacterium]